MQNPQTIKEAFLPLNAKLYEFESERYLISPGKNDELYAEDIVEILLKTVPLFNEIEINREAKMYEKRVRDIIKDLKYIEKEPVYNIQGSEMGQKATTQKRKETLMEECNHELLTYLNFLITVQKSSINGIDDSKINMSESLVLELPSELKISKVGLSFKPNFSTREAALFLHYLQEIKFSPEYSKNSMATLAQFLFWRNEQNIREEFSLPDFPLFSKDLKRLKEKLIMLTTLIEEELKKAEAKPKSKKEM